jgi:protein-tyrosine phosphatase
MRGFIDLHCHYVAGIDDGAREDGEGLEMLRALRAIGFERVIATPHMRPGLFDNEKPDLESAFERMRPGFAAEALPETALSSEHYFDDQVFSRILKDEALPYPGKKAILLEFYGENLPPMLDRCFAQLRRAGLLPVIAHPERYRFFWRSLDALERLVEAGAGALLDTAALVGKYGARPQAAAEAILERGLYHAACSDAHRVADVAEVANGIRRIKELYDADEVEFLLAEGPRALLAGELPK